MSWCLGLLDSWTLGIPPSSVFPPSAWTPREARLPGHAVLYVDAQVHLGSPRPRYRSVSNSNCKRSLVVVSSAAPLITSCLSFATLGCLDPRLGSILSTFLHCQPTSSLAAPSPLVFASTKRYRYKLSDQLQPQLQHPHHGQVLASRIRQSLC